MKSETIGNCTLYLGDCLDVMKTMGGGIDTVVSDPPYGMNYVSNHRKEKFEVIQNDETVEVTLKVIDWAIKNAKHSSYFFGRWENILDYPKPKSFITWVKNNHGAGDLKHEHGRKTENIFFYQGLEHDWVGKRALDVITCARVLSYLHPTEKPVSLMRKIVGWTKGVVFDPFMGSGSTGVACVQLDRKFIGVEIDEGYFNIACKRIEQAVEEKSLSIF